MLSRLVAPCPALLATAGSAGFSGNLEMCLAPRVFGVSEPLTTQQHEAQRDEQRFLANAWKELGTR
jgi:hypothetical protein